MFARLPVTSAAVAAGMLLAPASASAQSYPYQGPQNYGTGAYSQPYDYNNRYPQADRYGQDDRYGYDDRYRDGRYGQDECRDSRNNRQAGGAVVGGVLGAVVGSQLGARGRRTEGSVLGGVLGAAVGAGVGGSSARDCDRYGSDYRYGDSQYGNSPYGDSRYDDRYGYPTDSRYDDRGGYGYSQQQTYGYQSQAYGYDRYESERSGYDYDRGYSTDRYQSGYGPESYACRTIETRSYDRSGRLVTRYEQSCPDRY
ncbi:MAG: glycine zipper 2TM domain-containing protein [Pseudomonadota bacterium]|nr:glycine zipper 2TM domain-containing protein [Pseudomonadota bacterium]